MRFTTFILWSSGFAKQRYQLLSLFRVNREGSRQRPRGELLRLLPKLEVNATGISRESNLSFELRDIELENEAKEAPPVSTATTCPTFALPNMIKAVTPGAANL